MGQQALEERSGPSATSALAPWLSVRRRIPSVSGRAGGRRAAGRTALAPYYGVGEPRRSR